MIALAGYALRWNSHPAIARKHFGFSELSFIRLTEEGPESIQNILEVEAYGKWQ